MRTVYEWVTEETDEHGDIIDTAGWATLAAAIQHAEGSERRCIISLRRDSGNDEEGLQDRTQAYSKTEFENGLPIPKRFLPMFDIIPEKFRD